MEHQQKQTSITVFYSYASADKQWRDQLTCYSSQSTQTRQAIIQADTRQTSMHRNNDGTRASVAV